MNPEDKDPKNDGVIRTSPASLPKESAPHENDREKSFYIVGMGGSAGSLEAFEQFLQNMPDDTGLAFVIVSHLDPTHKGILPELLARVTTMKVLQAKDGMKVQPNHVYVIPPNKDMSILHKTLQLLEPSMPRGFRAPIDFFFKHLADDQGANSICIIFSGTGTDGTLGLKAIKEKLGMAMAQDIQFGQVRRNAPERHQYRSHRLCGTGKRTACKAAWICESRLQDDRRAASRREENYWRAAKDIRPYPGSNRKRLQPLQEEHNSPPN